MHKENNLSHLVLQQIEQWMHVGTDSDVIMSFYFNSPKIHISEYSRSRVQYQLSSGQVRWAVTKLKCLKFLQKIIDIRQYSWPDSVQLYSSVQLQLS